MDITSFLTREEPIAGLELSDTHIRIVLLGQVKGAPAPFVVAQAEEPLPEGVIVHGSIVDAGSVSDAIKRLVKKARIGIRYVIVSIPAGLAYVKLFDFPKTIKDRKLEETMELAVGFQLPLKPESVYLDWQHTSDMSVNEVVLAAARRELIDPIIIAIEAAGLKPIAIEPHTFAIARTIDAPDDKTILLIDDTSPSEIHITAIRNRTTVFSRTLPTASFRTKDALEKEIHRISEYCAIEHQPIESTILLRDATPRPGLVKWPAAKEHSGEWMVSLGAALRGSIPRSQDAMISLMPMGTAQAYRQQKIIAFVELLSNLTVGISLFFAAAFIGTWVLLSTIQQRTLARLEAVKALPVAPDVADLESRAGKLNTVITAASATMKNIPRWSVILSELQNRMTPGITVTGVSFPTPEGTLTVTAIAQDRMQLNAFKRSMEGSPLFKDVAIPLTNLEQKERIPFQISFVLKDTRAMYEIQ